MSRPTLLILSFSRLESDPRVQKQLDLFAQDHDLVTCGYGPAPAQAARHYRIPDERLSWRYPRIAVMLRQYSWSYRHNPAVEWALANLAAESFDLVLANDVDAAGVAEALRPRLGFHVDLHEFAPLQNSEMLRFRLFVAPFLRWQLRRFVSRAASSTTVCRTIAERYRDEFGLDPGIVMNAPPFVDAEPSPVATPIRLVHAGAALRNRRLEVLIDAVAQVDPGIRFTLDLYLTPNDPAYLDELAARAASVKGVRVLAPVPFRELVATLGSKDVGLHILAPTNFNNTYALPNKFFEYVQARLGLIIGPSPEMAAILTARGFGAVTEDFTADALARTLTRVTPETVVEWKQRADAAAEYLSAETQTAGWAEALRRLASAAAKD